MCKGFGQIGSIIDGKIYQKWHFTVRIVFNFTISVDLAILRPVLI